LNKSEMLRGIFRRETNGREYIAFVDGIRFIAISTVVLFHLIGFYVSKGIVFPVVHLLPPLHITGGRGVDVFFVLSAFILGTNTLKASRKQSMWVFYRARLYRICPPFFIAMFIIFVANIWLLKEFSFGELLPSFLATITYTFNILSHLLSLPELSAVSWTLEIEIQFYLLFPLLAKLYYLIPFQRKVILITGTFGCALLRYLFPLPFTSIYDVMPLFFLGMLLADLHHQGKEKQLSALLSLGGSILSLYLLFYNALDENWGFFGMLLYLSILFAFFYCTTRGKYTRMCLSVPPISAIGGMCYSIYLVHTSSISVLDKVLLKWFPSHGPYYYVSFQLVCVALFSTAFYLIIERPFLRTNKKERK